MAIRSDRKSTKLGMVLYYAILALAIVVSVAVLILYGFESFIMSAFIGGAISIGSGYILGVSRFNR